MSFHQAVHRATEAAIARLGDDIGEHVRRIGQEIVTAYAAERAAATEEIRREIEADAERRIAESARRAREEAAEEFAAGLAATGVRLVASDAGAEQQVTARTIVQPALRSVRDSARAVAEAATLGGVLDALADGATLEVSRTAVLLVEHDALRPWRLSGFEGGAAETALSDARRRGLAELFETGASVAVPAAAPGSAPLAFVTPSPAAPGVAVPLVVGGEVVGVVYGDAGADELASRPGWREALELLAVAASQRLENLTLHRAGQVDLRPWGRRSEPADGREEAPVAEARRFARRLLSDIVLYNGEAVAAGRAERDLASRLDHEIREARTRYAARIDEALPGRDAIFEDELIRTLAAGEPDRLGRREQEATPPGVGSST